MWRLHWNTFDPSKSVRGLVPVVDLKQPYYGYQSREAKQYAKDAGDNLGRPIGAGITALLSEKHCSTFSDDLSD